MFSKFYLSRGGGVVALKGSYPLDAGSNPAPAILANHWFFTIFSTDQKKIYEIVVTSLGCCSTQSTLANVRVLFFLKGINYDL